MRAKLSIWQLLLILVGIIAIVMITAYNPKYPSYPEASLYGAEPNGAMLITKLLDNRSIKYSIIGSKVVNWPEKSTVCIVEPSSFQDAFTTGYYNDQDLRIWLKQGGKLIIFGSGDFLNKTETISPTLFIEKEEQKSDYKDVEFFPILKADDIELTSTQGVPSPLSNLITSTSGKTVKISKSDKFTENVDSLFLESTPKEIIKAEGTELKTYINLKSLSKGWDYLVGEYQFGNGGIILINNPQIIYNQSLTKADNAQFVLNVLTINKEQIHLVDLSNTGDNNEAKLFSLIFFNPWGRLVIIAAVAVFILRLDDLFYFVKPYSEPKSIRRSIMEYIRAQGWTYYRAQANTLAAQALVDGLKRKLMKAYCLPAMPSIQFIIRKLSEVADENDYLKPNCQMVISMLHQTEISDKISSVELKILTETMQKLEPYLIKHFKY